LPPATIKGGLLISGLYDLLPVSLSSRSEYVRFTEAIIEALSPQRHVDRLNCSILIALGTSETPEFQRQARDFAAAAKNGDRYNHFEILETLANPYGFLGNAALDMMRLTSAVARRTGKRS
jgi:arylformamidase